ncbi:hypothetical protein QUA27_03605 [Microcoleus sp. Pol14C6]|uniref:hypothetical protein n=1 Tax=Microcoleus sp. Pol14C4 TaxID=3055398 RepID=UPI002FD0DDDC
MFESPTPKDRDNRLAIDCLCLDCKHLYSRIIFCTPGSILRSIARQTPSIDGTMNFRLGIGTLKEEGRGKREEGFSYLGQGISRKVRHKYLNIQVLPNSYQA